MSHDVKTRQMNRIGAVPLHAQLRDAIQQEILSGIYRVGDQIPPDRDISKIYDVSRNTARRALADLEAAGFVKKIQGKGTFVVDRKLQSSSTQVIGVGLYEASCLFKPFYSMIVSGMAEVATREGLHVQLIVTGGAPEVTEKSLYERVIEQKGVGGLALIDHSVSDDEIVGLHDSGVPVVLFDRAVPGYDFTSVMVDNRGGMFQLVEYLHGLGHRDIGLVLHGDGPPPVQARYEGYRSAIDILGLEFHPEWILHYVELNDVFEAEFVAKFHARHRPTALVCGEDYAAILAESLLLKLGYRVPEDWSVVGFDNIPQSAYCVSQITTIDPGLVNIGREMARLLIANIGSQPVSGTKQVSRSQLIIRESAGPVKPTLGIE